MAFGAAAGATSTAATTGTATAAGTAAATSSSALAASTAGSTVGIASQIGAGSTAGAASGAGTLAGSAGALGNTAGTLAATNASTGLGASGIPLASAANYSLPTAGVGAMGGGGGGGAGLSTLPVGGKSPDSNGGNYNFGNQALGKQSSFVKDSPVPTNIESPQAPTNNTQTSNIEQSMIPYDGKLPFLEWLAGAYKGYNTHGGKMSGLKNSQVIANRVGQSMKDYARAKGGNYSSDTMDLAYRNNALAVQQQLGRAPTGNEAMMQFIQAIKAGGNTGGNTGGQTKPQLTEEQLQILASIV